MNFGIGVVVGLSIALGLNLIAFLGVCIWEKCQAKKKSKKIVEVVIDEE